MAIGVCGKGPVFTTISGQLRRKGYPRHWALKVLRSSRSFGRSFEVQELEDFVLALLRWKRPKPGSRAGRESSARRARREWRIERARALQPLRLILGPKFLLLEEAFSLSPIEAEILALACWLAFDIDMRDAIEDLCARTRGGVVRSVAEVFEVSRGVAASALGPTSPLVRFGLLDSSAEQELFALAPSRRVAVYLESAEQTIADLLSSVLDASPEPTLDLADFSFVSDDVRLVLGLLENVPAPQIFLHGPPGTGKTELARALVRRAGLSSYDIGGARADEPLTLEQRWQAYHLGVFAVMHRGERAALIVDEADEMLGSERGLFSMRPPQDKLRINRLLEARAVPVLWIANESATLEPSYLRRFDFVLPMHVPHERARYHYASRYLEPVGVSEEVRRAIAAHSQLVPADAAAAARVAAAIGVGDAAAADQAALRYLDHLYGTTARERIRPRTTAFGEHNLDWVNTSPSARSFAESPPTSARFCFHGPPGTGKTVLARALASKLDRRLLERRPSDLLSKWVGETEARTRAVFDEAEELEGVLLLDEVDSMLSDRSGASRSWEVSMTNEFLAALERFDGIIVATTNRFDALDPAVLRRFDYKVRFEPPTAAQRILIWRALCARFGCDGARYEDAVEELAGFTAGDAAIVARRARHDDPTAPWLYEALCAERATKPEFRRRSIGFV